MRTELPSPDAADVHCPVCASPVEPAHSHCWSCGIRLAGPHATELRWLAAELRRVDEARTWLISRRGELFDELARLPRPIPSESAARQEREYGQQTAGAAAPLGRSAGGLGAPMEPAAQGAPRPGARRPEVSGRTAARLLLAAGATLVVIAVTIFTIA